MTHAVKQAYRRMAACIHRREKAKEQMCRGIKKMVDEGCLDTE